MPTFREIAVAIGIRESSASAAITDHLNRLEIKGYLRREYGKSRAIALTEQAFAWLDAHASQPRGGETIAQANAESR